jgi:hypothetical protein
MNKNLVPQEFKTGDIVSHVSNPDLKMAILQPYYERITISSAFGKRRSEDQYFKGSYICEWITETKNQDLIHQSMLTLAQISSSSLV